MLPCNERIVSIFVLPRLALHRSSPKIQNYWFAGLSRDEVIIVSTLVPFFGLAIIAAVAVLLYRRRNQKGTHPPNDARTSTGGASAVYLEENRVIHHPSGRASFNGMWSNPTLPQSIAITEGVIQLAVRTLYYPYVLGHSENYCI